jgi:hypothetical protein
MKILTIFKIIILFYLAANTGNLLYECIADEISEFEKYILAGLIICIFVVVLSIIAVEASRLKMRNVKRLLVFYRCFALLMIAWMILGIFITADSSRKLILFDKKHFRGH